MSHRVKEKSGKLPKLRVDTVEGMLRSENPKTVRLRNIFASALAAGTLLIGSRVESQQLIQSTNIDVTTWGCIPDGTNCVAQNIVSNSQYITINYNAGYFAPKIGDVLELYGGGPPGLSSGAPVAGTNQDLIATVIGVNGSTIELNKLAQVNSNSIACFYGTWDPPYMQNLLNECTNLITSGQYTNVTLSFPPGIYSFIPSSALEPFEMSQSTATYPAVELQTGGTTWVGLGSGATLFEGGAWQDEPPNGYEYRGTIIQSAGPIQNYTLPWIMTNMVLDCGDKMFRIGVNGSFPGSPIDGSGWDYTSHAVFDDGSLPQHELRMFFNVNITRSGGENLENNGAANGALPSLWVFGNCTWTTSMATGLGSFSDPHIVTNCTFSGLAEAFEFYDAYSLSYSLMANSIVTNCGDTCDFDGANVGGVNPPYYFSNNLVYSQGDGIEMNPMANLYVLNNTIYGSGNIGVYVGIPGIVLSTSNDTNINVNGNWFTNCGGPFIIVEGGDSKETEWLTATNNYGVGGGQFYGSGGGPLSYSYINFNTLVNGSGTEGNNTFWYPYSGYLNNFTEKYQVPGNSSVNIISYKNGVQQELTTWNNGSVFEVECDSYGGGHGVIPENAMIQIANPNGSSGTATVYLSDVNPQNPISLPQGATILIEISPATAPNWPPGSYTWTVVPSPNYAGQAGLQSVTQ